MHKGEEKIEFFFVQTLSNLPNLVVSAKTGFALVSKGLRSNFFRQTKNRLFLKKRRWSAWKSNPGPQDGRRRRNHGAMAATLYFYLLRSVINYSIATTYPDLGISSFDSSFALKDKESNKIVLFCKNGAFHTSSFY